MNGKALTLAVPSSNAALKSTSLGFPTIGKSKFLGRKSIARMTYARRRSAEAPRTSVEGILSLLFRIAMAKSR